MSKRIKILIAVSLAFALSLMICRKCESPILPFKEQKFEIAEKVIDLEIDPAYAKQAKKIDHFFAKRFKWRQFNGSILFAIDGKVVIKKTYGFSDIRKKTLLELDSKFQLASVSKQFTAFAIMLLEERGKLSYDDDVTKYFPKFPYPGITIQMLLTHLSGLPNYTYFMEKYWTNKDSAMSNVDVIDVMIKHQPMRYYPPNKKFDYSNTGYVVLGAIVEKASGMSFKNFMEEEIFTPFGMFNSRVFCKGSEPIEKRVNGYHLNRKIIPNNGLDGAVGDKGVYSTIEDMFIWDQRMHQNTLISDTALAKAFIPQSKRKGNKNYGYGWRILTLKNGKQIPYHYGWWHGFRSYTIHVPENKASIVILNNSIKGNFYKVTELLELVDLY